MVTDPEAIRFCNEAVRPLCEELRALKAKIDDATTRWYADINTTIPNDPNEPIEDGRESEGVSRLTGADIHGAMAQLITAAAVNEEIIRKPCVRFLSAE